MKKTAKIISALFLFAAVTTATVHAHCQIPCGIYNDEARVVLLKEHITTIEKSMKQIEAGQNQNQTVRWVVNKENHADKIIEIATNYFLAQRIKADKPNYEENLKTLHQIIVYSMKAKQTTDLKNVEKLNELVSHLERTYLGVKK